MHLKKSRVTEESPAAEPILRHQPRPPRRRRTSSPGRPRSVVGHWGFGGWHAATVYFQALHPIGIVVPCQAALGDAPPNWSDFSHRFQAVAQQFTKLLYYCVFVMPEVQ